jgi:hypothetical protein
MPTAHSAGPGAACQPVASGTRPLGALVLRITRCAQAVPVQQREPVRPPFTGAQIGHHLLGDHPNFDIAAHRLATSNSNALLRRHDAVDARSTSGARGCPTSQNLCGSVFATRSICEDRARDELGEMVDTWCRRGLIMEPRERGDQRKKIGANEVCPRDAGGLSSGKPRRTQSLTVLPAQCAIPASVPTVATSAVFLADRSAPSVRPITRPSHVDHRFSAIDHPKPSVAAPHRTENSVRTCRGVSTECGVRPVRRRGAVNVLEFGVDAPGPGELVFEDDDAARGIECGALVDQFAGPGGDAELVTGVAAVPALRTPGGQQFGGVKAAEECLCHAEDLGGMAHAVGRVVLVVELPGRVVVGRIVLNGVTPFPCTGPPAP